MVFEAIFLSIFLFSILVGLKRVLNRRRGAGEAVAIRTATRGKSRDSIRKIRWIGMEELVELMGSDPDMVLFRLVDEAYHRERSSGFPGELEVNHSQLEEAVPWIPPHSTLVIYRPAGIDPSEERRLASIVSGREALLLSGGLTPELAESFEMAGTYANEM
jgi:hypothetical protein